MIKIESPFHPLAQLEGARIVVLNWRDVQHPQAGDPAPATPER